MLLWPLQQLLSAQTNQMPSSTYPKPLRCDPCGNPSHYGPPFQATPFWALWAFLGSLETQGCPMSLPMLCFFVHACHRPRPCWDRHGPMSAQAARQTSTGRSSRPAGVCCLICPKSNSKLAWAGSCAGLSSPSIQIGMMLYGRGGTFSVQPTAILPLIMSMPSLNS